MFSSVYSLAMSKRTQVISTRVSLLLKKMIEDYVSNSIYINDSNFMRDAIKEKLVRDAPDLVKRHLE